MGSCTGLYMADWGGLTGLGDRTASSRAGSTGAGGAGAGTVVLMGRMRRMVVLGSVGTLLCSGRPQGILNKSR